MPIEVRYAPNAQALGQVAAYGGGAENTMRAAQMQAQQLQALLQYNAQRNASSDQLDAAEMQTNERAGEAAGRFQSAADDRNAYGQAQARHDDQVAQQLESRNQNRYDIESTRQEGIQGRTDQRQDARAELQRVQLSAQEQRTANQIQAQLDLNDRLKADGTIDADEHERTRVGLVAQIAPYRQRQTRTQQLTRQAGAQDFQEQLQSSIMQFPPGHENAGQPVINADGNMLHAAPNGRIEAIPQYRSFTPSDLIKLRESIMAAATSRSEALTEDQLGQRVSEQVAALGGRPAPVAPTPDDLGRIPVPNNPWGRAQPTPGQAALQPGAAGVQQPQFRPSPTGMPLGDPGTPNPRTPAPVNEGVSAIGTFAASPEGQPFRAELTNIATRAQQLFNVYGTERDMPPAQRQWITSSRERLGQIRNIVREGNAGPLAPSGGAGATAAPGGSAAPAATINPDHPSGLDGLIQGIRDWFSPPSYNRAGAS